MLSNPDALQLRNKIRSHFSSRILGGLRFNYLVYFRTYADAVFLAFALFKHESVACLFLFPVRCVSQFILNIQLIARDARERHFYFVIPLLGG
jgi:hypothetical protein